MTAPVSQTWDAGSDADSRVCLYTADANGTLLPLVEMGSIPLDGTWEVLHRGGWMPFTERYRDHTVLVVARPVGSKWYSGDGV